MKTAEALAGTIDIYNRLTGDHGAGAAELYLGEALSVQGRFEESDITAYRAAMLPEQAGNITVIYGSSLLLGINAIYRGDMTGLGKAVDYLETKSSSCAFMQGRSLNRHMVETVPRLSAGTDDGNQPFSAVAPRRIRYALGSHLHEFHDKNLPDH